MPVPDSAMVCGALAALSAIVSEAVAGPAAVGWKFTRSSQLAPPARTEPHEFKSENSDAFAPVAATVFIVSGAPPVFVMVTVWAVPGMPITTFPKFRLEGETDAAAGVMPVPLSATAWGEFAELSTMLSEAEAKAAAIGLKMTATLQVAPLANVEPQLLVRENSDAPVPVS